MLLGGAFVTLLLGSVLYTMAPSEMRIAYDGTRVKVRATVEEILSALHWKKLSLNKVRAAPERPVSRQLEPNPFGPQRSRQAPAAAGVRSWLHFGKEAEDHQ